MSEKLVLGIDDAGRGPVIGPMVLAGCLMNQNLETKLKELGVMDSKLLTRKKRQDLVGTIKENSLGIKAQAITPIEIDTGMGIGLNLNQVEALAAGAIINELTKSLSEEQKADLTIIVDCPSINTSSWKKQLLEYVIEKKLKIKCEHKADFNYPVVSAASIIAKTTRDSLIEDLKKQFNIDFGSGYPADPKTKDFLKKNVNNQTYKGLFRESWATFQTAKGLIKQSRLPDY